MPASLGRLGAGNSCATIIPQAAPPERPRRSRQAVRGRARLQSGRNSRTVYAALAAGAVQPDSSRFVIPTGAGAKATAEWRDLGFRNDARPRRLVLTRISSPSHPPQPRHTSPSQDREAAPRDVPLEPASPTGSASPDSARSPDIPFLQQQIVLSAAAAPPSASPGKNAPRREPHRRPSSDPQLPTAPHDRPNFQEPCHLS